MSGKDRIWTDEDRKKHSERSKLLWSDPEYAARARAARRESFDKAWADPAKREKMLNNLLYARCSPSFRANNSTPERRKASSELMRRLNADPEHRRRQADGVQAFWRTPEPGRKKWLSTRNKKANDTRRGFKVPPSMAAEYHFLRKRKKLGAQEAGRILGLVK